ncbi:hypothetical protein [Nonomuraea sp. NPDC048826]|uniref:hypothetical protein n=1 Tax=Nonomuraea sp. NPDC048826 TaxID=3364347 RepID=UPI003716F4FF
MDVHEARRRHEDALLSLPAVTGVSTGHDESGQDVLVVYVTHEISPRDGAEPAIPQTLEGFPVKVVEIGFPTAQQT